MLGHQRRGVRRVKGNDNAGVWRGLTGKETGIIHFQILGFESCFEKRYLLS